MERFKRIAWTGALALLCAFALVGRAHAANCHVAVAGFGYGCQTAGASGSQVFDLDFDAAGRTADGPGGRFQCFCSSTGGRVEGLEAGLGIVCVQSRGGDDGVVFSARAAGKRLIQGTITSIADPDPPVASQLACERRPD
jgi:hypothetical protein